MMPKVLVGTRTNDDKASSEATALRSVPGLAADRFKVGGVVGGGRGPIRMAGGSCAAHSELAADMLKVGVVVGGGRATVEGGRGQMCFALCQGLLLNGSRCVV